MKNIRTFESFITEASWKDFKPQSVKWNTKPNNWDDVNASLLLSHLPETSREDLLTNYIANNIYDSEEYNMKNPLHMYEDIWGGGDAPRFLVVRHEGNFYLINTGGNNYSRHVVRINDLDKWMDIEANLY